MTELQMRKPHGKKSSVQRKLLRGFVFSAVRYFLLSGETSLAGDAEAVEVESDAANPLSSAA